MSATAGRADRSTLTALTTNLDIDDVADPALRLAFFRYMVDLADANYDFTTGLLSAGALSRLGVVNVKDYNASGDGATTTTGSITTGLKALTVASVSTLSVGQGISIAGAGAAGVALVTSIVAINGLVITTADAASTTVVAVVVSHDDTAAIQAAINTAHTLKTTLFFPPGHYKVTSSLIIKDRFNLIGSNHYWSAGNDPTKWECFIDCTATKLFVGLTAGTSSAHYTSFIDMKNMVFKGTGIGSIAFDFFDLRSSIITQCEFYNFDYVINGRVQEVSEIFNNRFINTYTSVLSTRLSTLKSTITDSKMHHNFISGTAEGNSILIDLENGNYSDIHHNFIDFAYMGVRLAQSSILVNVNDNLFDVCYRSIELTSATKCDTSNNRIAKCSKSDYTLFLALSAAKIATYSATDWIGINVGHGDNYLTMVGNVAFKSDILIALDCTAPNNISTKGNINGYSTGRVIYLNRSLDSNNVNDGLNLDLSELNYRTVTSLPATTGLTFYSTFTGNLLYYNNVLYRNDSGVWKDVTGSRYGTAIPSSGNWDRGDKLLHNTPSAGGYIGWVCTTAGTFGTLNSGSTTGSITNGTTSLVVNSATGLTVGAYITITGVSGIKKVTAISGTTITIDSAANATVSGAAVAFSAPTLKEFGAIVA